jgi:Holliday junction resolvase-like predicted endonuclease
MEGSAMVVERNLLISLLKLTENGPVLIENVKKGACITSRIAVKLLETLQNEGAVYMKNGTVETNSYGRLKIAIKALALGADVETWAVLPCSLLITKTIKALALGADVETVSNLLHWQEFEKIAAVALERNGYVAAKNVRFKSAGRRWEIDVVGCKKPLVLCIDCKHWHRGMSPTALKRITEAQMQRTRALAESLPSADLKIECAKWESARFVPAVLSLIQGSFKFYEQVPIVPVLQLQDFLAQVPAYTDSLKVFTREFKHLHHDL